MAQVIAEQRDIDFVLFEPFEAEKLCEIEKYKNFDKKTFKGYQRHPGHGFPWKKAWELPEERR